MLDAGDLLYLPPGVAHEGTALGDGCMTCSIGFRAPAWRELLEPWLDALASRPVTAGRFADPGAVPTRTPARLPQVLVQSAFAALTRRTPTRGDARDALLTFLTEPKSNIVFARARPALSPAQFRAAARARGLRLDRRTRMLYSGNAIAINGELLAENGDRAVLHVLADLRSLVPAQTTGLPAATWRELATWHAAGWLHLA